MRLLDLTGQRFTRLVVIAQAPNKYGRRVSWTVQCDCGRVLAVSSNSLRKGVTTSCGCRNIEAMRARSVTHNESNTGKKTPEYFSWQAMKTRCYNHRRREYHRYGGRGITMCARWRDSYPAFLEDMGRRPAPGMSIDRIDNNAGYSKANCRWATSRQQSRNRSVALSLAQVRDIKRRLNGHETQRQIAAAFGVCSQTVSNINCGHSWADVETAA